MTSSLLSTIRIVLVRPSHPGNIGAVARAMKTMGLAELYLVAPKQFPSADATALATHAQDILNSAVIVDDLLSALANVHRVYATSANRRTTPLPIFDARAASLQLLSEANTQKIAIVFGPENHGLNNEELLFAHALIHIPTAADYHSLNLAQAVQILAYELQMTGRPLSLAKNPTENKVSVADMVKFYTQLQQTLIDVGFLDPQKPRQLMPKLKRLFNRAMLDRAELDILWGIVRAIQSQRYNSG